MKTKKQKSYFLGLMAEYYVIFLFFFKGYKLLKHRYKTKFGEIDLIFRKNKSIIAVEVKARKNKNISIGEVVYQKQFYRIMNSLKIFLNKNEMYSNFDVMIDVVLIKNIFKVKHIKNTWVER